MTDEHEVVEKMGSREDATGFLRAAGLNYKFSHAVSQLYGDSSLKGVEEGLKVIAEGVASGNTEYLEDLLLMQAELLNHIFLKHTYGLEQAETVPQLRVYADVALKAQNQSRRTLMALADLKNPKRATFIKNQNNAVNQQVNVGEPNGETTNEGLESKNLEKIPTDEIIEDLNHVMDTRAKAEATRGDPAVEAMGEGISKDRAENA